MRSFLRGPCFPILALLAVAAGGGPALADGYGSDSSLPFFDQIVDWMGWHDLSGERRDLLSFCLFVYAMAFGVLTNFTFKGRGFGIVMNGVIGVVGVCLGLYFCGSRFRILPQNLPEHTLFNVILIIACLGSAILLVVSAGVKGVTLKALGRFVDTFDRPEKPQPVGLHIEKLPPRIAAALRKQ